MKRTIITGLLLVGASAGSFAGNCTGVDISTGYVSSPTFSLGNFTVCASAPNGDRWQEWHQGTQGSATSGTLTEYAKGPADPVDPSHDVGTWSGNSSSVTYNYSGGSSYTFEIWLLLGGPYSTTWYYCGSGPTNTTQVATISKLFLGQGSCD